MRRLAKSWEGPRMADIVTAITRTAGDCECEREGPMHRMNWLCSAVLLLMAGCSTATYRGISPVATSFKQDPNFPGFKENYYGATADFDLDQPGSYLVVPQDQDADPTQPKPIRIDEPAGGGTGHGSAGGSD